MIKKILFLLSLVFLSLNLFAAQSWKPYVVKNLPGPLQFITPKKTTLKEVEKVLGKASLVEKDKQYYELNNFKYALEITYHNKTVSEFSYTFINSRPDIAPLNLDVKSLSSFPGSGSSAGRFLKYSDKDGELIIDPTDKKIFSVRVK